MPADYNIPMTDAQITEALQLMVERVSEGWAQETYDGSPVGSGSPYYHKSSKWWATQAADAAARAEAAVPAGTAGAVFFDRAQTLTTAQQKQARQNIGAGTGNRNLIDNWWFGTGVINQRGATSGSTHNAYAIDRWKLQFGASSTGTWDISSGSLVITITSGSYVYFRQPIDTPANWNGLTLTGSIMFSDGTIYSGTITRAAGTSQALVDYTATGSRANLSISSQEMISIAVGNAASIKAVKIEVGTASTLANDAPPNYTEELAKCQYNGILKLNELHLLYGKALGTTAALFMIPWKHRAGDSGTTYISGLISKIYHSGGAITVSTNPAKNRADTDFIRLTVTGLSGLTDNEPLIGEIGTNGLIVSNDL